MEPTAAESDYHIMSESSNDRPANRMPIRILVDDKEFSGVDERSVINKLRREKAYTRKRRKATQWKVSYLEAKEADINEAAQTLACNLRGIALCARCLDIEKPQVPGAQHRHLREDGTYSCRLNEK